MYRKQVRRRRAVLVALVVTCLVLISTHFSEGEDGPLHASQSGVAAVFAPVGSVAGDALKPFRDLVNWFDETFDARSENDDLRGEVQQLRRELVDTKDLTEKYEEIKGAVQLASNRADAFDPVTVNVRGRSPMSWNQSLIIDKGRNDGIRTDDAVVSADGLVGRVEEAMGGSARVVLLTDQSSQVTARIVAKKGPVGLLGPDVGNPKDLIFTQIDTDRGITGKPTVETAGFNDDERGLSSLFPAGIPIGEVNEVEPGQQELSGESRVTPFADLSDLEILVVLTGGPE